MAKDTLIEQIRAGREEITALWRGVDEAELLRRPGPQEDWSVKDLIAHLTYWEQHMINNVKMLLKGESPEYVSDNLDAINARVFEDNKDRSLADIQADYERSLGEVIAQIEAMSEDDIYNPQKFTWTKGESLVPMIAGDTYEHYQDHIDDVRKWQGRISQG